MIAWSKSVCLPGLRGMVGAAVCALMLLAGKAPVNAAATPMDWSSVIGQALPAVVNISIESITTKNGKEQRGREVGTGFLIDPSGTIVTNKHVIDGAFRITVTLSDKSQWDAKLLAATEMLDLAIVKIDAGRPLPFLKFADSDKARIGDPLIVIGNPLGLGTSVSSGIVSAVHRDLMNTPVDDYIQTDAAINHGNSGGPVLDRDGEVIGIATILVTNTEGEGSNGLGFAIASTEAAYAVRHLLHPDTGTVGWIGVHLQDVTPPIQQAFHLKNPGGALVTRAEDDSPADYAGLRPGDVIIRYGDVAPANSRQVMAEVIRTPINTTVPLVVLRNGKEMQVPITVEEWADLETPEGSMVQSMEHAAAVQPPDLGLVLSPMTDAARRLYGIQGDKGVVVAAVDPTSDAYTHAITAGDVIEEVQGIPVTSPDEVIQAVEHARQTSRFVALLVDRKGDQRWVPLYSGHTPLDAGPPAAISSAAPQGSEVAKPAGSDKP